MSNAVNIFLRKAVDQRGIPFPVNADNQQPRPEGRVMLVLIRMDFMRV